MRLKTIQCAWDRIRGKDVIKKNPVATHYGDKFIHDDSEAQDILSQELEKRNPLLVARFGRTELKIVDWFMRHREMPKVKFPERRREKIRDLSGFINPTDRELTKFSCLFIQIVRDIDVLGVWFVVNERELCLEYLPVGAHLVSLGSLGPGVVHKRPWTAHLAGKKVLVVHPFAETIASQYGKREALFANPEVLPEFELVTIKAYQSIAGNNPWGFASWFDALDDMKRKIDAVDFDVALIGAGAYGMFLAHHCKMLGKQAIHMGGATQILFGIKGKRWEKSDFATRFYNEHWVRPSPQETPEGSATVEGGCYW